jgi:hypothetical protein
MLATQAINRGMRLEAIAALLGHQKMEITLIYEKIANRVVADEYAAVSAKIDALYGQPPALPADYESTGMTWTATRRPARRCRHTWPSGDRSARMARPRPSGPAAPSACPWRRAAGGQ